MEQTNKPKAVFPGSFDPYTVAHHELVKAAAKLFNVEILICVNPYKDSGMFNSTERREIIENVLRKEGIENVTVSIWSGMVTQYCKQKKIEFIVRGIRYSNAAEELDLSRIYYEDDYVQTVFFPTYEADHQNVSSTRVREYINHGNQLWEWLVPYDAVETINRFVTIKRREQIR